MAVLTKKNRHLKASTNDYDWLGSGVYFWENDPDRAEQFAKEGMEGRVTKGKIKKPFVVGAIIDLGLCCNLFDQPALQEMKRAHTEMFALMEEFGLPMPSNGERQLLRKLDREVIEYMHRLRERVEGPKKLAQYQTVRAAFPEGDPLYPGTTICEKNHIQIAVRDLSCIRGYFLPRDLVDLPQ